MSTPIGSEINMKVLSFILLALYAIGANATTYYVAITGSDATGDGSIDRPWKTPAFGASSLRSDGDTLLIRGGVYEVITPTSNRSAAIFPRANNCTIAAYPGESVTLRGRGGKFPTGGVIGAISGYSGLLIDRLAIQGMVMFDGNGRGSRPSRIQNSELSVGGDGWPGTSQGGVVWMDDAVNIEVANNLIHSNGWGAETGTSANNGLFMIYECTDCVIENNTIRNSVGTGITMKDDVRNVVIRYNWIRDNTGAGIWTGNNTAETYLKSVDVHNNIFTNNNTGHVDEHGAITLVVETSQVNIFNNTFHKNHGGAVQQWTAGTSVPFAFFNNLSYAPQGMHLLWPYGTTDFTATYMNFNQYFDGAGWRYRSNALSTLPQWQTACTKLLAECESNSMVTDPGFLNETGNWSSATDYRRRLYPENGRGGVYPKVIGAYVTGTERIGHTRNVPPGAKPPSQLTVD